FSVKVNANEKVILFTGLPSTVTDVTFDVEILSVKVKKFPELTDEWVKDNYGFETVAELRERIAEAAGQERAKYMPQLKENLALGVLSERLQGEPPASMVEKAEAELLKNFYQQITRQGITLDVYLKNNGLSAEEFKKDIKKQAADQVKDDLALDAWARHKGFVATEEDVKDEFASSGVDDPESLYKEWVAAGNIHLIREGVLRTKAMKDILDNLIDVADEMPQKKAKKPAKKAEEKPAEEAKKPAAKKSDASAAKKPAAKKAEAAPAKKPAAKKTEDAPAKKPAAKKSGTKASEK
ncbi:MAG: trigger factor, partial [Eggerthellaceae bacterium]|nr:trigger factor [Eggerthellaceae bacterium]